MKRRLLAIVLVLMMAVSLLPVTAAADPGGIAVAVGGRYFTSVNQTINIGGGTATLSMPDPYAYSYVLTLRNVNLTSFTELYSDGGVTAYAGIAIFLGGFHHQGFSVKFEGNNSITAPKHGDNAIYEGIYCDGYINIKGDKLTINGVDVGIENYGEDAIPMIDLHLRVKNLTVNATDLAMFCDTVSFDEGTYNLNSTGFCGISVVNDITIPSAMNAKVNLNVTPDVSKGYNMAFGLVCDGTAYLDDGFTARVNYNASGYKGSEEITAFGVYGKDMFCNATVGVNLTAGSNCSAVGIYGVNINSQDKNSPLIVNVSIKGSHGESCAILADSYLSIWSIGEAAVYGANEYDSAIESYGRMFMKSDNFWAYTDCTSSDFGAVFAIAEGGNENNIYTDDVIYPADAKLTCIDEENSAYIMADPDGKPVNELVFSKKNDYLFRDIDKAGDAPYKDAILWAVDGGITNGITTVTFCPSQTCTRAQVVTFLWRAMGCPEPETTVNPFTDVKENSYYYKAVLWAYEKGITTGTGDTLFSPDQGCTRAQVVTFLWRTMEKPEPVSTENKFVDNKSTGTNAPFYTAILWAAEKGITTGTDDTHFSPGKVCTRAQIVTFLYRTFEGQEISRTISDYRFVLGEEPNADTKKCAYARRDGTFGQGETWDYFPVNLYLTYDIITNRGIRNEENMYTIYLPMSIAEGTSSHQDENWANIVGTYGNKIVFNYGSSNEGKVFAWFDCADMSAKPGHTTEKTLVIGNKVVYFHAGRFSIADLDTGKMGIYDYSYIDLAVCDETIYFSCYFGNGNNIAVKKLNLDNMAIKELLTCSKTSSIVFDKTGYNVTDYVDGEEITTHYDFS